MQNVVIATRIKEQCKQHGIAVAKLLESCDVRKGLIYDLEKRDKSPTVDTISRIADYFDCSVDYLLGRSDTP